MNSCEIVMVRGINDADGYPCGRTSNKECCDCGSELCELHFESCEMCQETYCSMCLFFHMSLRHAKPNTAPKQDGAPERRIA